MRSNLVNFTLNPANQIVGELREIDFSCEVPKDSSDDEIRQISPNELRTRLGDGSPPLLLDVREPWEMEICRIEGAVALPLSHLRQSPPVDLPFELSTESTVVYCKAGVRSMMACDILRQHYGISKVENLIGGIDLWSEEVDPGLPRY